MSGYSLIIIRINWNWKCARLQCCSGQRAQTPDGRHILHVFCGRVLHASLTLPLLIRYQENKLILTFFRLNIRKAFAGIHRDTVIRYENNFMAQCAILLIIHTLALVISVVLFSSATHSIPSTASETNILATPKQRVCPFHGVTKVGI
jgi:hypothetical protein